MLASATRPNALPLFANAIKRAYPVDPNANAKESLRIV